MLHYGRDDFADEAELVRMLSRERSKDMVSDYTATFADRRQIVLEQPALERGAPVPSPEPSATRKVATLEPSPALSDAVQRHGEIVRAMRFARRLSNPYTAEQRQELAASRAQLNMIRPQAALDLETALANKPSLIAEAAEGRTAATIRAMQFEAELRAEPRLRADTFVQRWQALDRQLMVPRFSGHLC